MLDFAELHDVADAHAPDERTQYALPTVKPPPAQAFAQLRQTFGAAADGIDNPNGRYSTPARIDPADLRTVPPVDLRTPTARVLDAEARDLRTAGDKIVELVQQVSTLQAVCSELARRVTALEGRG